MHYIFIYLGAGIITLWGVSHIIPTKAVLKAMGAISSENRRLLTMGWIGEGLTLCFIGLLVIFVTVEGGTDHIVSQLIYRICALMLFLLAFLTSVTGAKTDILPIKVCPFVKIASAVLIYAGSLV